MQQTTSFHTYGIVGDGRLARHLLHYFKLKNLNVYQWHRKMSRGAEATLKTCDVILVLISDDKIESWIKKNVWVKKKIVLHASGSLVTRYAQGFHPLFNFTPKLFELSTYEQIPFVFEKGTHTFKKLFPDLSNPSFEISKKDRPLYHALTVMAGNFPIILWQACSQMYSSKLKLPAEVFIPFLNNCLEEFKRDGKNALTGPLVRNDVKTLERNRRSLKKSALKPIFKVFVKQFPKLVKQHLVQLPKAKPSPRVSETARKVEPSRDTASTLHA